jgi:hypothetical protein
MESRANMPTGRVIYTVYQNGKPLECVDKSNLIVTKAKFITAHLLAGAADYEISQIGFGTNATTPALGNTTLTNTVLGTLGIPTYPKTNQVSFPFSLDEDTGNGTDISEIGLLTTNDLLYARLTRTTPLAKTDAITIDGTWIITF